MENLNSLWKNTKVVKIENGPHIVVIQSVELKETKKLPVRPMFAWDLVLPDNRHYFHNRVLGSETALYFAKQDFINLGLSEEVIDDLELLQQSLSKLVGFTIEIELKENNGFQNATIKQLISSFDEEEIPF